MKLTDDERAAFNAVVIGTPDEDFERDPLAAMEQLFAAGIAYAQKWRSMESAPHEGSVLLRNDHWVYVSHWRHSEQLWVINGSGGAIVSKPTGWLPLPPTEAK